MQDGLRREIELENRQLGWLALVKLSSMVGVELIHCEGQALKILQDDLLLSSTLGEFVASSYRDSIAEESISPRWILATIQLESLLEGQQLDAELSWGDIKVCLLLYSNRWVCERVWIYANHVRNPISEFGFLLWNYTPSNPWAGYTVRRGMLWMRVSYKIWGSTCVCQRHGELGGG